MEHRYCAHCAKRAPIGSRAVRYYYSPETDEVALCAKGAAEMRASGVELTECES